MPPIKRKKCCIPYCNNAQEISNKQFFKLAANIEGRGKWLSIFGKTISAKSQVLYCCEDHFDLPNDADNYIRYKYISGTKLKLRPNVLPQKKLPVNVCRLCLKLIYNGEDLVDISLKKNAENTKIVEATLPEIDLNMTIEPVACIKCFKCLEQYYNTKQNILKSEIIIVNCIKSIVKKSPTRLVKNCQIDLFEEFNEIKEMKEKEQYKDEIASTDEQRDKYAQDIVLHIEDTNTSHLTQCDIKPVKENCINQDAPNELNNIISSENSVNNAGNIHDGVPVSRENILDKCVQHSVLPYTVLDSSVTISEENIYIQVDNSSAENIVFSERNHFSEESDH